MSQAVVVQRQKPDQSSVLVGTEAKNPVPSMTNPTWEEIRGLSWVFFEDD
ncbi:MAG: hypothetical protein R3237_03760 [Nitrosopumilaceae archaeon]|nr:hypothetical protein [Nitrosopumilaceae archaeon]